jgi:hypothetical protein
VTGSARLDELIAAVGALAPADVDRVRRETGATGSRVLVLFAAKEREARRFLPALLDAIRVMPDVELAIKPHPAETPDVYATAVAGLSNARVLPSGAPLPPLLAAARALVTVNSTVAIDALSLGLPSLVIGSPTTSPRSWTQGSWRVRAPATKCGRRSPKSCMIRSFATGLNAGLFIQPTGRWGRGAIRRPDPRPGLSTGDNDHEDEVDECEF